MKIEGDLYHQLGHVFRARVGQGFILFTDGSDDFIYTIQEIKKDCLVAEQTGIQVPLLRGRKQEEGNKGVFTETKLTVFHALPNKTNTIELIVEKLTELGVSRVVFFRADNSQLSEISQNKQERIRKISIEALEQCGGCNPLAIEYGGDDIATIVQKEGELIHIVATQSGKRDISLTSQSLGLWIGPEGGWSTKEEKYFEQKTITKWSFADRVLRLETAGIVGAGILKYLQA